MYQNILNNVSKCIVLTEKEQDFFFNLLEEKQHPKKTMLLQEGEICQFEAYVEQGCIRTYYIDEKGFEVTLQFGIEDWWVSDIASFSDQKPSFLYIETLEDVKLLTLSPQNKELLLAEIPKFERVFRLLLQRNLSATQHRLVNTLAMSAQEKYLEFLRKYPSIPQRVPQHYIASYLGISAEFLSKIRTRLSKS
uniref:Crp/Fnr family transcriptional regulator n=1 Tax=Flavobacterium sp. TaxID=239 RepID=UPI00404B3B59